MLNLILHLAFAALGAVFALLAIRSAQRCKSILTAMHANESLIRSLRGKVEVHDSELDAVSDSIAKLRGKFYAERRKSQPDTSSSDYPEEVTGAATVDVASLKAHLRRKAGLVAGQPAPHQ
jgi:hypothetical protein